MAISRIPKTSCKVSPHLNDQADEILALERALSLVVACIQHAKAADTASYGPMNH